MPPKKKNAGPSAQLGISTRARVDPTRKVGNANAVAAGVDLSRIGVISDRELAWIQRLATEGDQGTFSDYRSAQDQQRKEASNKHKAGWTDTTEARHERFLQRQEEEKQEAERRKQALDDLYRQEDEETRRQVKARAELRQMIEDPRGRNVKSVKMLNDALKGREQQVAEREKLKAAESAGRGQELAEVQARDWGQAAEDARARLDARQRNVDCKNANLEMLAEQIDERRQQRAEYRGERPTVDAEAAEEAEENRQEKEERKQRDLQNGLENKANSRKAASKAEKLQRRIQEDAATAQQREREEAKMESMKQSTAQKQQQKQAVFEERKRVGMDRYQEDVAKPGPTYRTQDVFEQKGQSFLDKMYAGDSKRVEQQRETLRHADYGETAQQAEAQASWRAPQHRRAEATASGFLTKEEEAAHLLEMRQNPEKVRAEAEAEAAAQLAAAQRLKEEQRLQAQERREQNLSEKRAQQEEDLRQEQQQKLDDERYQQFIDAQLPKDINPVLRKKAHEFQ